MSLSHSPKVVTSNLILYLDAANPISYIGSGTTWTDLSGNGNTGTLTNGPTYSSANNGSIVFDGVDDYVDIPTLNSSTAIDFNNSTVIYVAKLSTLPNSRNTVFSQYYGGTGAQHEFQDTGNLRSNYRQNSASTPELNAPNGSGQITTDVIYHISVTYTNKTIEHYKNAISLGSATNSTQSDVNGIGSVNIGRNSSAGLYFKGSMYNVMVYSRVLTSSEIQQNFDAIRGRYSI